MGKPVKWETTKQVKSDFFETRTVGENIKKKMVKQYKQVIPVKWQKPENGKKKQ